MGVYKEIPKADGSGITTFYRLSTDNATVETTSTGSTETMFDYNNVLNKPSINDVVLIGNKTSADLGLQPAGNYITEIPEEYIIESELEAKDYATKTYVLEQLNNTEHFHREIVDALPLTGKDNVLYLVAKKGTDKDIYNEYIWTGTDYELLGTTAVDLSDYYKKSEVDNLIDTRVKKETDKGLSTNDYTTAEKTKLASLENYDDTELRTAVSNLHNYDDTQVRNNIAGLDTRLDVIEPRVDLLEDQIPQKLEAVRLIKSGDYWEWKDAHDNTLSYNIARNRLAQDHVILILEQLDNDGKTIPADYKVEGDRIKIVYKDLDDLCHELYMGPHDYDTVTGGPVITVSNATESRWNSLKIEGKSEQEATTGKNLYNFKDTSNVGDHTSANDDGWITSTYDNSNGTSTKFNNYFTHDLNIKPNTKYLLILEVKTVSGNGNVYPVSDSSQSGQFNNEKLYPFSSLKAGGIYIDTITSKSTFPSDNVGIRSFVSWTKGLSGSITFRLSVLEDTTVTPETFVYEPYTGGQPSPNPYYPQKIKTIKGIRNLFDGILTLGGINNNTGDYITTNNSVMGEQYIEVFPNTEYTISTDKTYSVFVHFYDSNKNQISYDNTLNTPRTLKTPENCSYIRLRTRQSENITNLSSKIQLEEGSTAHPYVPYGNYLRIDNVGKNLYNFKDIAYIKDGITTDDGWITITADNTSGTSTIFKNYYTKNLNLKTNTNYAIVMEVKNVSTTGSSNMYVTGVFKTEGQFASQTTHALSSLSNNTIKVDTVSTRSSFTNINYGLRTFLSVAAGVKSTITFRLSVLEDTTVTPETFKYEPYRNNITYINMGDEKLCSIGDVKDSLSVDLDSGIVTKQVKIGKVVLDGSENWADDRPATNSYRYYIRLVNASQSDTTNNLAYCSHFALLPQAGTVTSIGFTIINSTLYIRLSTTGNDLADFKTWLKEQYDNGTPVTVYYILTEPHEDQVTILSQDTLGKLAFLNDGSNTVTFNFGDVTPTNNITIGYDTNTNYNEDIILGTDTHYREPVANIAALPTKAELGEIRKTLDTNDLFLYDGTAWIPTDKGVAIDLSNYLAKNNTVAYKPSTDYNPATKKYVDDSIKDLLIPTKTSQLINDSGFVLKTANDLTNYYNKSNTYNKAEVNALVNQGGGGSQTTITLNGVATTTPTFYAPVAGGVAGQVLTSTGSSAPTWGTLSYNEITGTPSLSTVAISGNYSDLSNKPTIPTKTSQLTNDSNYTTLYSVENNYADGTTICGWATTAPDGTNMTTEYGMTPSEASSITAGKKYEWQSRVSFSGMNYGVCYYASHDRGTADDGTSYNYVSAKIGNGTDWVSFCWDNSTVYSGTTWPGASGGKACFAGDTLVWTPEGEKKIKDIQIGDRVMSINIEKDIIEPREITKLVNHEEEEILVITTKDGTIEVTGSHPFYEKKKGKANARILEVGDELMDDKFGLHKITKIETKAFNDTVYEIVVDSTHNYFIGKKHIRVFNEPSVIKD